MIIQPAEFTTENGCRVTVMPADAGLPADAEGVEGKTLIALNVDDGQIASTFIDGDWHSIRTASLLLTDAERIQLIEALGGTA